MEEYFKEQYFKYYTALVKYAQFYCTDQDEASSSVQQVFLHVWEKREELLSGDDLKSYLYKAVRNRVFNSFRRKQINEELGEEYTDSSQGAHEGMEFKELQDKVNSAIEELPERCRFIFELSRHEELSYKQIASHLDISVKTVENQMSKALKILRSKIYFPDN